MDKDTIKALIKNDKPVCLMDAGLRIAMLQIEVTEFECLQSTSEIDRPLWLRLTDNIGWRAHNNTRETYRLRPDYQEQPAIIEEKVFVEDNMLRYTHDEDHHSALMWAPNRPDFIGFKSDGWLFGRLYKNKNNGLIESRIKAKSIDQYDVLPIDAVLFSK